jgi:exosortase/archaeosortase family protein
VVNLGLAGEQNHGTSQQQTTKRKQPTTAPNPIAFLAKFAASFAALYAIVLWLPLGAWLEFVAAVEAKLVTTASVPATSAATTIACASQQFEIVAECSGLVMVSLLASLLYATGARNAGKTLLWAAPALIAFNLLRLFGTLYLACTLGAFALEPTHFAFWIVDALAVLAIWAYSQKII